MIDRLRIHAADGTWVVRAGGAVIGESSAALELTEGDFPPVIYFPRDDLAMAFLEPSETTTLDQSKGRATYFHIAAKSELIRDAGWTYEAPLAGAERIAGHIAFYGDRVTLEMV